MPDAGSTAIALIGANGMLARKVRELAPSRVALYDFDLPDFDLADPHSVRKALEPLRPAVILNCAAYTDVDGCESNVELAFRVNGEGPGHLAAAARDLDATLVHVSTDYVFAGDGNVPYREQDPVGPRSVYGRSKLAGEEAIAASGLQRFFILRTSWLFGPGGNNFVETMIRLGRERDELRVVADQIGSPTYTGDLARAIYQLLGQEEGPAEASAPGPCGLYHFANSGHCSWHGFAAAVLEGARQQGEPIRARRVVPITSAEFPVPAPRPAYSVLDTGKYRAVTGAPVPTWQDALERYLQER